jgi:serine/threonine protein kinase
MPLDPGTKLGPYEIGERIGAGGMGEVYRARDPRLGRDVAIKVIAASPHPDLLARFERETRATAVLAHPNILTIFDVGTHEGLPFLVSELLEGETLGRRLASGPLEPLRAIELGLQLVRGVVAAHALRIVHRDLKPDNLFVTAQGTLKILDFGLAKLKPPAFGDSDETTLGTSDAGRLLGTPAYVSPERDIGGGGTMFPAACAIGCSRGLQIASQGSHSAKAASPQVTPPSFGAFDIEATVP